jgi:hypothetical protein
VFDWRLSAIVDTNDSFFEEYYGLQKELETLA